MQCKLANTRLEEKNEPPAGKCIHFPPLIWGRSFTWKELSNPFRFPQPVHVVLERATGGGIASLNSPFLPIAIDGTRASRYNAGLRST